MLPVHWSELEGFDMPNLPTSPSLPSPGAATFGDWLALPEDSGAELINGRIERPVFASLDHGRIQRKLSRILDPFDHKPGERYLGGWWIGCEVDVIIGKDGVRPDLVGWRRDLHPQKPAPGPNGAIEARPDWIAEIVSPGNASRDYKDKFFIYLNAGVPYYWIIDPRPRTMLALHRYDGTTFVDGGMSDMTFRPKPFESLELRIGSLFDDDD